MASIKDLKKRIQSTKNTQQTTKAMKMVSAAYLRRAQGAIANQRPYAKRMGSLIQLFTSMPEMKIDSPLLKGAEAEGDAAPKRLHLVLITSDRGLCGGFNSNVIRFAQRWIRDNGSQYASVQVSFVGRKGYEFLRTRGVKVENYFQELGGKVTFAKARKLAEALTETFVSGQFDEVKIIFNEFVNAVSQVPTIEHFLPLQPKAADAAETEERGMFIVKPSAEEVLKELLGKHFGIQAFRILLESQAGEHGARMSAMENATKNAGEMIAALTLEYNKQRQAGITKELLEIIAGSESQKVS